MSRIPDKEYMLRQFDFLKIINNKSMSMDELSSILGCSNPVVRNMFRILKYDYGFDIFSNDISSIFGSHGGSNLKKYKLRIMRSASRIYYYTPKTVFDFVDKVYDIIEENNKEGNVSQLRGHIIYSLGLKKYYKKTSNGRYCSSPAELKFETQKANALKRNAHVKPSTLLKRIILRGGEGRLFDDVIDEAFIVKKEVYISDDV